MQCNYNSFIQIINFHGLFRNALRCRKTGACRILVPLRYSLPSTSQKRNVWLSQKGVKWGEIARVCTGYCVKLFEQEDEKQLEIHHWVTQMKLQDFSF